MIGQAAASNRAASSVKHSATLIALSVAMPISGSICTAPAESNARISPPPLPAKARWPGLHFRYLHVTIVALDRFKRPKFNVSRRIISRDKAFEGAVPREKDFVLGWYVHFHGRLTPELSRAAKRLRLE